MSSDDPVAVRRSRRERKKPNKASIALQQIKRSRETGVREESSLEVAEGLFEYVGEDEYARLVQQRQEEAFIADDDGSYCEHGREIFDEEVEPAPKQKATERNKKAGPSRRVAKQSSNIKTMLMSRGDGSQRRKKEDNASLDGDALLSQLLEEMKSDPGSSKGGVASSKGGVASSKGGVARSHHKPSTPHRPPSSFTPRTSTPPTHQRSMPLKKIKVVKTEDLPSPSPPSPSPPPQFDMECGDSVGIECGAVEDDGMEVAEEERPSVPEAAVSSSGWETVREELPQTQETLSSIQVDSSSLPLQEREGEDVLVFYWLDAYEDVLHQPGTVYLFGKIWVPEANTHVSCCVAVKNIERCLYFLPREKVLNRAGKPTDQEVTMEDVYREFNEKYAEPYRIMRFSSKRVLKKYAFERPEVPQECEYLEVRYSAAHPAPPMAAQGQTFSHVFGTNTSSLERLILHCHLKGPCWLHIRHPKSPPQAVSWCRVECMVEGMGKVGVAKEQAPPPPLVVLALSLKVTLNPRNGTNEVLCVGGLIHSAIGLDRPPPKTPFEADFCTIRRPLDRDFPFRFEEFVKRKGFNVEATPSERALLAYLLAKLHRVDPDIIVGHNLTSYHLEVLQHRLATCHVPNWSRISRIRRKDMPKGRAAGQTLCAGRPVCDVKASARELIRAPSYDLPELANSVLHVKHCSLEHEDILRAFGHCEDLSGMIAHTMDEAMLSLRLMYELNVLPLAYQITAIAGNTLSRTLLGGRAERNEFLLLHAFTAKDYICPDKVPASKRAQHNEDPEEGEHVPTGSGRGRRKPAYSGGLVLEPKKGFYDRFILLLDFNSLYPSIMQEYNICFTTVDHAHCSPDEEGGYGHLRLPDPGEPLGVLPSEIRVLVERRKQVKLLMKGARDNPEQYLQYDIRQKALKLTANSMYGCLGFANSRFHAKPLAALITGKGREILSHTKELAQKLNLEVIYGDTDSIMIDSQTRDLEEAEKIAQRVKTEVNRLYRLLEIDVDGIFKALLLLKKKKYAAVAVEWKDGHMVERRELKGVDIVRRDWCGLAKTTGHYILDQILSGAPLDEVIDKNLSYLRKVCEEVQEGKVPLEQFVITKSMTKAPSDYPDKRSLPHVQVALRMLSRNLRVQPGDVIPYVMCKGKASQPMALRAYHPDEVRRESHLEVDSQYYLQHQLHAVVSRLCEPIEGLDTAQIADCLGLDSSSYRNASRGNEEEHWEASLLGVGSGGMASQPAAPLLVRCPHCKKAVEVKGAQGGDERVGLQCNECRKALGVGRIANQITLSVRGCIRKYYAGWLVCEDHSCQFRTRNIPVALEEASSRCPGCQQGRLREEYPASALYGQLAHFEELFTLKQGDGDCQRLRDHVANLLGLNEYAKVNLARLFPDLA